MPPGDDLPSRLTMWPGPEGRQATKLPRQEATPLKD